MTYEKNRQLIAFLKEHGEEILDLVEDPQKAENHPLVPYARVFLEIAPTDISRGKYMEDLRQLFSGLEAHPADPPPPKDLRLCQVTIKGSQPTSGANSIALFTPLVLNQGRAMREQTMFRQDREARQLAGSWVKTDIVHQNGKDAREGRDIRTLDLMRTLLAAIFLDLQARGLPLDGMKRYLSDPVFLYRKLQTSPNPLARIYFYNSIHDYFPLQFTDLVKYLEQARAQSLDEEAPHLPQRFPHAMQLWSQLQTASQPLENWRLIDLAAMSPPDPFALFEEEMLLQLESTTNNLYGEVGLMVPMIEFFLFLLKEHSDDKDLLEIWRKRDTQWLEELMSEKGWTRERIERLRAVKMPVVVVFEEDGILTKALPEEIVLAFQGRRSESWSQPTRLRGVFLGQSPEQFSNLMQDMRGILVTGSTEATASRVSSQFGVTMPRNYEVQAGRSSEGSSHAEFGISWLRSADNFVLFVRDSWRFRGSIGINFSDETDPVVRFLVRWGAPQFKQPAGSSNTPDYISLPKDDEGQPLRNARVWGRKEQLLVELTTMEDLYRRGYRFAMNVAGEQKVLGFSDVNKVANGMLHRFGITYKPGYLPPEIPQQLLMRKRIELGDFELVHALCQQAYKA